MSVCKQCKQTPFPRPLFFTTTRPTFFTTTLTQLSRPIPGITYRLERGDLDVAVALEVALRVVPARVSLCLWVGCVGTRFTHTVMPPLMPLGSAVF